MPTVLRRSGPDFERDGQTITPKAMIHTCEDCSAPNAAFLLWDGKKRTAWCGWREGKPVCVAPVAPKP